MATNVTHTPARLIGWCGLVNICAGIFYGLETFLHPPRSITGIPAMMQSTVLGVSWSLVHTFGIVAFVLGLFGLVGLYARQIERARRIVGSNPFQVTRRHR